MVPVRTDYDREKLSAILEWEPHTAVVDIIEIIDNLNSYDLLTEVDSNEALGEYFAIDCQMFSAVPENLRYYIDYEKYGRDLRLSLDVVIGFKQPADFESACLPL